MQRKTSKKKARRKFHGLDLDGGSVLFRRLASVRRAAARHGNVAVYCKRRCKQISKQANKKMYRTK